MSPFPVIVFHNPACGTSRNAVAMIRAAGYEPTVIEYLQDGWDREQLVELFSEAGLSAREAMREKGTPAADLGLLDPAASDDQVLDAMVAHPVLVNRPFVVTPKGVVLARPSERVFDVLERRPDRFVKEDGEVVELAPQ
ncbi:arsenate reductase (glutaredoxin) [Caulobacter sp. 17J80-11]|uniref:arsenate reductase (glutaredoxin) n=1 Tax=Caulobacter sp. 17J80-11 TaxID=2763502 RepID=UPI001653DD53|nr:arsenate reductase (glutaredoxin) [Caulobacter sp. 17J80-11]MBC6981253.1 arsenate reductase (glutaredoxin) [Caulobacter sp. 17J80-11]